MATLLMIFVLIKSLKSLMSLNSEFLKKLPPINLVERSPVPILLLNVAILYKAFSRFFNTIDIVR
jgi:hypothetical protein